MRISVDGVVACDSQLFSDTWCAVCRVSLHCIIPQIVHPFSVSGSKRCTQIRSCDATFILIGSTATIAIRGESTPPPGDLDRSLDDIAGTFCSLSNFVVPHIPISYKAVSV